MRIPYVLADRILVYDLAHITEDFFRGGDRWPDPGLEPVAKRIKVAVRADAGICMGAPCPAKILHRFKDEIGFIRALRLQMIGRADAGNPGPRDQDIEMPIYVLRHGASLRFVLPESSRGT